MRLARVIGKVVCTIKDPALSGKKILVLKPIDFEGRERPGSLIALDSIGAGLGEEVYYVRGKEAAFPWHPVDLPSDSAIVGILDRSNFVLEKIESPPASSEQEGPDADR